MNLLGRLRERVRPFYLRHIYFPLYPGRKPPSFEICWRFPEAAPAPLAGNEPGGPALVFWPMNDWHGRVQRTHHLVRGLSRLGYRCIYVNPHLGREFPARPRGGEGVRLVEVGPEIFELHVHLPREPVFHHRLLREEEARRLADAVIAVLEAMGAPGAVQVLAFPVWFRAAEMVRRRRGAPILYDCHDYLPGFAAVAEAIVEEETALFRGSDAVVCSSEALRERARGFVQPGTRCVLVRNAVTREFFGARGGGRARPETVTIGYAGALESWFDVPAVWAAALAHPEWIFCLVGRVDEERVRELGALANIRFAGEVPFEELPRYFEQFSVGTIPFVLSSLIRATDPIKVYEYLAAGLPVVAADLPELERFGSLVGRYRGPEDFVRLLEEAVRTDNPGAAAGRTAAVENETWDERVAVLAGELERLGDSARSPMG